jgi:hypothetical protein
MADLLFDCEPPGPSAARIRVRYLGKDIGQGLCFPSGAVEFTFKSSLTRIERHEQEKAFENRGRIRGKYCPTLEVNNPDGTKTVLLDGAIEIYLI